MFKAGDFVTVGGRLGIVAKTGAELESDVSDHTGVWFGTCDSDSPEVWTIPTEYLKPGPVPTYKH